MKSYVVSINEKNLKSNVSGFMRLLNVFEEIDIVIKENKIDYLSIDLIRVKNFDLNLFAVLSAKCVEYSNVGVRIRLLNINKELYKKLYSYDFPLINANSKKSDNIKYIQFRTDQSVKFNNYIRNIFDQKINNLPHMSESLKSKIIDGLGEVFGNVGMHTESKHVYFCGQITFGTSKRLDITIVNIGRTIKQNVSEYCKIMGIKEPANCIAWSSKDGNSTKMGKTGGLGLAILKDFIKMNRGKLQILSDNEYWEYGKYDKLINDIKGCFFGTIVNIEFNLSDRNSYRLKTDIDINNIL